MPPSCFEDGDLKIPKNFTVAVLVVAIPAALCLGARLQRQQDADQIDGLIRRLVEYRDELQFMDDAWADCILAEPVRFPDETTLHIAVAQ